MLSVAVCSLHVVFRIGNCNSSEAVKAMALTKGLALAMATAMAVAAVNGDCGGGDNGNGVGMLSVAVCSLHDRQQQK